jgi:2-acylglycerol O-acyltransferase 2
MNGIPSDYHLMKTTLESNHSISVAVGGMREMLGDEFIVKRRRGIFKMALETGTPIVPVISFGEQKLFSIVEVPKAIQDFLEPYDICICIPTLQSVRKWLGLLQSPLKDSIISVVGSPIPVSKIAEPTEEDISKLREQYTTALKELYEKENPSLIASKSDSILG